MTKKIWIGMALGATLSFGACDVAQQVLKDAAVSSVLSNKDIGDGLKEALRLGIFNGVDKLSVKGGFTNSAYRILLPEEARKVTDRLKSVPGFNRVEQVLIEKLNAGAEDAVQRAKPIFLAALTNMSIGDAMGILMGDKNAATSYLQRTTTDALMAEFMPIINSSLDKFEARKYWSDAMTAYNAIPFIQKKANTDLGDYVAKESLRGLFGMVEEKERGIRANASERSSDLLRKVFAKQDGR